MAGRLEKDEGTVLMRPRNKCEWHEQFNADFLCQDCSVMVCPYCALMEHKDHALTGPHEQEAHHKFNQRLKLDEEIKKLRKDLTDRMKRVGEMKRTCSQMSHTVEEATDQKLLSLQHQKERTETEKRHLERRINSMRNTLDEEKDRIYALLLSSEAADYGNAEGLHNLQSQMKHCLQSSLPRVDTFAQLQGKVERLHSSRSTSSLDEGIPLSGQRFLSLASSSFTAVQMEESSQGTSVGSSFRLSRSCSGSVSSMDCGSQDRERSRSRESATRTRRRESSSSSFSGGIQSSHHATQEMDPPPSQDFTPSTTQPQVTRGEQRRDGARGRAGKEISEQGEAGGARVKFHLADEESDEPTSGSGETGDGGSLQREGEECMEMEDSGASRKDEGGQGEASGRKGMENVPPQSDEICDLVLFELAEKQLLPGKLLPLGLRLGLKNNTIEIIKADHHGNIVGALYAVLQRWKKELSTDHPIEVHYNELSCVLEQIGLSTAADWLRDNWSK